MSLDTLFPLNLSFSLSKIREYGLPSEAFHTDKVWNKPFAECHNESELPFHNALDCFCQNMLICFHFKVFHYLLVTPVLSHHAVIPYRCMRITVAKPWDRFLGQTCVVCLTWSCVNFLCFPFVFLLLFNVSVIVSISIAPLEEAQRGESEYMGSNIGSATSKL